MAVIRRATVGDVAPILAFWTSATTVASATDDSASVERLLEFAPGALLVATDGDTIVGTVVVGWDGWRGSMYRLAVASEHRRRGIASALVREAERQLVANGARRLHLIVAEGEAPAAAFWEAAGYTPTGQTRFVKTLPGVDHASQGR